MTTDTDDTRGGVDWELGEAARKLGGVFGFEGAQADALRAAMADHAAAVGSKSTQMIAALFTPLMQEQQESRRALDTLVTTMQHISAVVVQIAAAQKKSDARLSKLEQRMDDSESRLAHIEAVLAARPAEREREHQAILDAIAERGGDGG